MFGMDTQRLILLMIFRPQGILGDKKEVAIGERS